MSQLNTELKNKNKWLAFLLAVILGPLGIHNFYLGRWKRGFIQGEQAISQDPRASFFYAQRVIGGRFVLGEATILQAEKEPGAPPAAVSLAAEYRKWCIKIGTPIVYSSNTVKEGVLS